MIVMGSPWLCLWPHSLNLSPPDCRHKVLQGGHTYGNSAKGMKRCMIAMRVPDVACGNSMSCRMHT
jgi:hypothetical protein